VQQSNVSLAELLALDEEWQQQFVSPYLLPSAKKTQVDDPALVPFVLVPMCEI